MRAVFLALISCGAPPPAVLLELSGLGRGESLTLTVVQGEVIATQNFKLDGGQSQTVALNSAGMTQGEVVVVAQSLRMLNSVESRGEARVTLSPVRPLATVVLPMRSFCTDGGTCSCARANCLGAEARCGSVPDVCGGILDCGDCPSGESCVAQDGGGHACSTATCAPAQCGAACGLKPDGCGRIIDCGACDAG